MEGVLGVVTLIAGVLAGFVLLGAAVAAAPKVWAFVKALARAPLTLEAVYAEFSPNGGGSLRDSVDRLEEKQGQILQWQHDHVEDEAAQFGSIRDDAANLDEYVHRRIHEILGELARMQAEKQLRRMGVDIDELKEKP